MAASRRRSLLWVSRLLVAAAASASLLTGCESALRPDAGSARLGDRYTQSLLVRMVMDGDLQNRSVAPTANRGVRELARVDSTGTTSAPTTFAVNPTTEPGRKPQNVRGIPNEWQEIDQTAGLVASQLMTPEGNIRVSLQECIARAMKHNLDIAVEAYTPAIRELQIMEAQSIFDPTFFGNHQFNNLDQPGASGISNRGITFTNQTGIRQLLPSGGQVQASLGDNYFDLNPPIGSTLAPSHGHAPFLSLGLSHPLLRGFGANVTYANIYLAQRDRSISLAQFRRRVITVCSDVEEAYHNLVLATASARIQEQLLADTDATRKRVWERRNIDVDVVAYDQVVAAVESRRAELVRARSALRTASDRLKGLINDPEFDVRGNGLMIPTDRPTSDPVAYNVAEIIDTALRQRTEIQEARLQVERADIVVDVTRNDLLPKADVTLAVQSNGSIYENDIAAAFSSTFNSARWIDYQAGLKWEIPLGNEEAQSRYHRRLQERRQALTNLVNTAQKVVLDVKVQVREVFTSFEEINARERARAATARELDGLNKKELLVALTPEFLRLKLDAQQRLANSEIAEIQSIVSYNIAITKLEQSKGTLLEYNRVAVNAEVPELPIQKLWLIGRSVEWHNPFQSK